MKKVIVIILVFSITVIPICSQSSKDLVILFETLGMTGSGKYAPFWHTSNRQGITMVEKNNGFTHASAIGGITSHCGFRLSYGMDAGYRVGLEKDFILQQLYTDFYYKWLGISIGMKGRWGDKNCSLSSGALTYSGNCKPIPEIRVGISDYVRMPLLGSWLSVKGHFGYGRLTDEKWRKNHTADGFVDGVLFHSKSAFIRWGDIERFPLLVSLGLEMNNLFGGISYRQGVETKMPSDVEAYWTVMFPFHHIEQQGNEDGDNLGSWHINIDYVHNDWHIGAYYEHFYEDHSSMLGIEYKNNTEGKKDFIFFGFRRNWFDGLFGIEVNTPKNIGAVRNVVFEFLNTKGLCGPINHSVAHTTADESMSVIEEVDGRDGLYNHDIYTSYSHYGYAIGNPVLISPAYNPNGSNRFRSNRVQMLHLGIEGGITNCIDYRALATTTRHWGQYGLPLKDVERVTSVMLECSYVMSDEYGWKFSLSGAMDFDSGSGGEYLLGNNLGVMLTVRRTWKVL